MAHLITIDGLAATGKSTIGQRLAEKLNYAFFDSGSVFHSAALYLLDNKITIDDVCRNSEILDGFHYSTLKVGSEIRFYVNGTDVSKEIRSAEVTKLSTEFSRYEIFQDLMYSIIRGLVKDKNVVVDGRNLGNKYMTFADVKFFINSDLDTRAERRSKQYANLNLSKNQAIEYLQKLDKIEIEKGVLNRASDAFVILNSGKTLEEVVNQMYEIVNNNLNFSNRRVRLLLNYACNYNCKFCHHEGIGSIKNNFMSAEDYEFICNNLKKSYNINYVNLSGGEPLLRRDFSEIVQSLSNLNIKVAVTTNGYYIDKHLADFKNVADLNLSIHSSDESKYDEITGTKNNFYKVLANIKNIRQLYPKMDIKLNVVYSSEVFKCFADVIDMINFAMKLKCTLKFIEVYPRNGKLFKDIGQLESNLTTLGYQLAKSEFRKKILCKKNNYIILEKCFCSAAEDEIDPKEYCAQHNDLFISSEGVITYCRCSDDGVNIFDSVKHRSSNEFCLKINEALNNLARNCKYGVSK